MTASVPSQRTGRDDAVVGCAVPRARPSMSRPHGGGGEILVAAVRPRCARWTVFSPARWHNARTRTFHHPFAAVLQGGRSSTRRSSRRPVRRRMRRGGRHL